MNSKFCLVADCGLHVTIIACHAFDRMATSANVGDKPPFKMLRFGTLPQNPIPFLKPGYVKTTHRDKLKSKVFPYFFLDLRQTAPMMPMRYFSIQGAVFTLAMSRRRGCLLQYIFLQKMCVLYLFKGSEGTWIQVAME